MYVGAFRELRGALLPSELAALLQADTPSAKDAAWQRFVHTYSQLLLHTSRSVHSDYDAAMDAYTYVLEQLERDDFRRLRAYNRSPFVAWLVVVTRRLCVDRLRTRYGRSGETRAVRRRLADLLADDLDPTAIPDGRTPHPDTELDARELSNALAVVVGRLEARDRLLLKLRYEDQLSAREIAQLLHVPTPFHVYRRLSAVLEELKAALKRRGIEGSEP